MLATIQNQRKEPELSDFTKFVDNETLIVSDPLLSKGKVDKFLGKIPTQKRNKISAFGTREENKKGDLVYASMVIKITSYRSARNSWEKI